MPYAPDLFLSHRMIGKLTWSSYQLLPLFKNSLYFNEKPIRLYTSKRLSLKVIRLYRMRKCMMAVKRAYDDRRITCTTTAEQCVWRSPYYHRFDKIHTALRPTLTSRP